MDSPNSHSSACSTDIHKGSIKRKRGSLWDGDEMEMQHFRDHQRQQLLNKSNKETSTFTAVDISQFQNHQIGQGYQAKHVIRQKNNDSIKGSQDAFIDATGKQSLLHEKKHEEEKEISSRKRRKSRKKEKSSKHKAKERKYSDSYDENFRKKKTKKNRKHHSRRDKYNHEDKYSDSDASNESIIENDVNIYLQCQPLRHFRIELEQLLQRNIEASKYR